MRFFYKIPVLLFCISFNQLAAQQPCSDETIMAVKGKWTTRANADMKAGNPQAIRIDKMQKVLQAAYPELKGMEAKWNPLFDKKPLFDNGPAAYQLQSAFFSYYCNKNVNQMRLGAETAVWFYVFANHFNWFLDDVTEYVIQNQPVYLLRKKAGEIKGYPVYEGNYNQRSNTGTYSSRAVIITRTGQLPWLPVTKKQFLTAFISLNETRFQESLTQTEKNITDKQQKASSIANMKQYHEEFMKPARLFLSSNSEQVLEQPAILNSDNLFQFKTFLAEEKGGMLVRLNPGYFDMNLPKYMPQFLIAYWMWDTGTSQNYWKEQVEKNFDFDALKAMIDK